MQVFEFTINERLVGLNEIVNKARGNKYAAAKMKKEQDELIYWMIKMNGKPKGMKFTGPVTIGFRYFEADKRRDPDNIEACRKFILDALVKAEVLAGDGWKHLAMPTPFLEPEFYIDGERPRVEVRIEGEA